MRESAREGGAGGGSRGYWERQKLVASKWTANSTMAIAKAAMENGMPEPPESFFETQDRLVGFFEENGELKVFEPNAVRDVPTLRRHGPTTSVPQAPPPTPALTGRHRRGR